MNIRLATPDDAPALARVHVDAWHEAYRDLVPDSFLQGFTVERRAERFRESLAAHEAETYLVERDGQAMGFVTLGGCRDRDVDPTTTGEIWGIYLAPVQWRKGIGRFLCERGEALLAARGHSVATLWVLEENTQARQFYEAMGYATDGETKEVNLGAPLVAVRYRKRLDAEPTAGTVGIIFAFASLIPWAVFSVLIARRLFQFGSGGPTRDAQ